MPADPAIRAALDVAKKMRCCWGRPCLVESGEMKPPCGMPFHTRDAAAVVVAFLRSPGMDGHLAGAHAIAAAVEAAAKEEAP